MIKRQFYNFANLCLTGFGEFVRHRATLKFGKVPITKTNKTSTEEKIALVVAYSVILGYFIKLFRISASMKYHVIAFTWLKLVELF